MNINKEKYVVYLVLSIYPCSTGCLEIFYHKLLPEMAKRENVAIITSCNKLKNPNYKVIIIKKRILSIPGTGKFGIIIHSASALIKFRKNVKIIHFPYTSNSGRWGLLFPLLKKFFKISYLLQIHGGGMKPWKKINLDRILFRYADKILAVSTIIKDEYEKRSGRTIEVGYPLVPFVKASESKDYIKAKLKFNLEDRIILFVGSLKELKSPDVLLNAYIQLGKQYIEKNNIKLIFVGEGVLKESLIKQVNSNDLSQRVIFTGNISYFKVSYYYKIADIYVIPSKFEGTPKSLLEAMFNKLPIIGSNVNGINNIIIHNTNGMLFKEDHINELEAHIRTLLNDEEKADYLAKAACKTYKKSFSFKNSVRQLIYSYNT